MAAVEFFDAVDCQERLNDTLKSIQKLETKVKQQANKLKAKDAQLRKLERDYQQLEDRFANICAENKSLLSKIRNQQKQEEEKRTKEEEKRLQTEALQHARDLARAEEEERQAVRDKYARKRQKETEFQQFLEYKRRKH